MYYYYLSFLYLKKKKTSKCNEMTFKAREQRSVNPMNVCGLTISSVLLVQLLLMASLCGGSTVEVSIS